MGWERHKGILARRPETAGIMVEVLEVVLTGFGVALAAPWLHRLTRHATGWLLALVPLAIAGRLGGYLPAVMRGEAFTFRHAWAPDFGVYLSFRLDGLSLLFALLISVIGALILIYAGGYLHGHPQLGRFYFSILLFMASMLGVALADNLIALFVFWELTSFSSYLLIGFDHEREAARRAALQALLVTGAGGLALLAGFLLLGQAGGSLEISELLLRSEAVRSSALYPAILLLVLAGAFTKSAQAPFHFWLPAAMEAPTPVSAYLHSATMVKAGVYLLARLQAALGGTDLWYVLVSAGGAVTLLLGALLAFRQDDLKRLLAYSTVSALGLMTMLLGIGTDTAVTAAMTFLLAHALYKGALFLVAGILDHETGTRHVAGLGGLRRAMPITASAAALAGISMAGLPPLLGMIGKELTLEAVLGAPLGSQWLSAAAMAASALFVALAGMVALQPFFGDLRPTPQPPHEAPLALWLGPLALGVGGLTAGLLPVLPGENLVGPAVAAVLQRPVEVHLALWHGVTRELGYAAAAVAGGAGLYAARAPLRRAAAALTLPGRWGPAQWYDRLLDGLNALATSQTRLLQNGYLRFYLMTVMGTATALAGYTLIGGDAVVWPGDWKAVHFYEGGVVLLMLAAAMVSVRSTSRLGAVAALGFVGYGVALVFVLFGAPDLAMTQFLIETLTVILLVLVLYYLPPFATLSRRPARLRDALVALAGGAVMTALVLAATYPTSSPALAAYFAQNSLPLGHGRNVVNVILVDFRSLDTLGEITVLSVAGIGVYALLKLRLGRRTP
jgi:multicomponent Na+:H+ antiporter subunit A